MSRKRERSPEGQRLHHKDRFLDIDRMVNEGLGGGRVTSQNGRVDDSTTDTMGNRESGFRGMDENVE